MTQDSYACIAFSPCLSSEMLETISKDVVRPESCIRLTPSDYDINGFYAYTIFLFQKSVPLAKIRSSLSRVLLEFPQLAGRLKNLYDFPRRGCIELNGEGVPLEHAKSEHLTVEHIVRTREFTDLVPRIENDPKHLFFVKYTSLACGGVALATAGNHIVLDASAYWSFMDAWARLARGESLCHGYVVDRAAMMPREPLQFQAQQVTQAQSFCETAIEPVHGIATFNKEELERLKSISGDGKLTKFECLAGYLWKSVATHVLPHGHKASSLGIMINARRLLSIPSCFFGNALGMAFPTSDTEQLIVKPSSYAASVIHDALRAFSAEHCLSLSDEWEHYWRQGKDAWEQFWQQSQARNVDKHRLFINSWAGFPMYECDFGEGKPAFASIAHKLENLSMFIQPTPDNGLEVLVSLQKEHLNAVLSDLNVLKNET